ncbi:MAG: tryptophan 2,3-dioxygenase family protein, partial [Myxococcota bacterium]
MSKPRAENYGDYLKIPALLELQNTVTEAHDELQFIVVHQAFELWFKLALFELEAARSAISNDEVPRAMHLLKRVEAIFRNLIPSFDVMETMRPADFLEFREELKPASGLQSSQFREIEYICGLRDERYLSLQNETIRERLKMRLDEPSLWDAFLTLMDRYDLARSTEKEVIDSLIKVMREPDHHPLSPLVDQLIAFDELFGLWRTRHVQMVMR